MSAKPTPRMTDQELLYVTQLKEEKGLSWIEILELFNKKFKKDKTFDALKKDYSRQRDALNEDSQYVKLYRSVISSKKSSTLNAKDIKSILQEWEKRDDILTAVEAAASTLNKVLSKPIQLPKSSKGKKGMTLELLISDVHVGKKTEFFDHEVLKRRLKQVSDTTIKEMQRAAQNYKIDRVILAFMGDLIESATMHGTESAKGCEFGNSRQVQEALTQMFHLIVAPISIAAAKLGAKIDAVGVTGNHDRTELHRTFNSPGEENVTWIIYKAMEEFTKLANLKNVTWHIPTDPWQYLQIYGEGVIYEHYDNVKGSNQRTGIESLMAKRINQIKKPVSFIRGGHFHEPMESGIGKIIINGNVPGNDGFSTVLGFDCKPSQTLNFYIKRDKTDTVERFTSFYKRFLIQLS